MDDDDDVGGWRDALVIALYAAVVVVIGCTLAWLALIGLVAIT